MLPQEKTPSTLTAAPHLEVLQSLIFTAQVTSLAAAIWTLATIPNRLLPVPSVCIWPGSPAFGSCFQRSLFRRPGSPPRKFAFVSAIACGVIATTENYEWYAAAQHPWLDPWFLEALGIAFAAYCIAFGEARHLVGHLTPRER